MLKKLLISLFVMCLVSITVIAEGNPWQFVGNDKGKLRGLRFIEISSFQATCLISTQNVPGQENTDYLIINDADNSSTIYICTSPVMVTFVTLWTSSAAAVLNVWIATTTLVTSASTYVTNVKVDNIYSNITTFADFIVFGSTAVVTGTVTIMGLTDLGIATENVDISTLPHSGSKIWLHITTITVTVSDICVGNGAALQPVNLRIGAGTLGSNKKSGNVIKLHVGDSISPTGMTQNSAVFGRVKEGGSTCIINIVETKFNTP